MGIPRAPETRRSGATASSRPVPVFNTFDLTPLRAGFRNPRTSFPGVTGHAADVSTPEQILRETLEVHAGLIIQSISQAATPRLRQNSMSRMGDAAANPVPSKLRAASTSSAEKRGPEVLLEDVKYKVKLECKICFDSTHVDTRAAARTAPLDLSLLLGIPSVPSAGTRSRVSACSTFLRNSFLLCVGILKL